MKDHVTDVDYDPRFKKFVGEHVLHKGPSNIPDRDKEGKVGDPNLFKDFEWTRNVGDAAWGCKVEFKAQFCYSRINRF